MNPKFVVVLPFICIAGVAHADVGSSLDRKSQSPDLPPVVVQANRQPESKRDAAPSATVITREEIADSGYTSLAEVVQKLGFVNTRSGLVGTRDASFDLRGFGGGNPDSNVAVVVDGVRYSEKELASARVSSIPLSAIEKVEIMRGGSSVAYGDGASGGVIRITTRQPQGNEPLSGSASVSIGSFDALETSIGLRGGAGKIGVTLDVTEASTDGYRQRSSEDFGSALAGLSWNTDRFIAGVKVGSETSDVEFPAQLNLVQFKSNPRQANPAPSKVGDFSFFNRNTTSVYLRSKNLPFDYGFDVSRREQSRSFKDGGATSTRDSVQDQVSVFVSDEAKIMGSVHQITLGSSVEETKLDAVALFAPTLFFTQGTQKSSSLFLTDDIRLSDDLRINAGYRLERLNQNRLDFDSDGSPASFAERGISLEAYELGFSKSLSPSLTTFAKVNKGFRVSNIDENEVFSRPAPGVLLKPQTSREIEAGLRNRVGSTEHVVRLFKIMLDNEISNINFSNINLDKTQRMGAEFEYSTELMNRVDFRAAYTYTDSEFRSGILSGSRVPLVPTHRVLLGAEYDFSDRFSSEVLLTAQSDQRLGGDLGTPTENAGVPGYTLTDLAFKYRMEKVKLIFSVNNVFDRDYFNQAFFNVFAAPGTDPVGVYPDPGRNFKLTAQFDF